ncbi:sulfurtransferase [Sphaerospermopsis kisseleviana CS-549]|jgi:thiosulfate/3-mercaptopyruvate sulfurtransferase|uniref:Sulfurtransferase n=2 Tax=Sphaerospermopsis TaxID=752201 RepID=A0A480A4G1_9CYAN|nr:MULTISPECIES: sulfurtransferase [Sphaerospermopsis]MDB9440003.1 sulfurtransferase [Sphaerospermopsis kisseleviana CS-549]BAZ83568.1 rhodanese-like protein [Sphaerospermopsis kisseleviana NIES-73]GCL39402.1 rhodanese-like protein [Sphaerospermopsis reniformis]
MMFKSFYLKNLKKPKLFALVTVFFAFLVSIPLLPLPVLSANSRANIQFVSPNWVAENAKDPNLRILDVRNFPLDYIEGHLPNAVNIADTAFRGPKEGLPVQYWENQKLGEIFANSGVTNNSRVLVYSDGRDVLGATMVAYLLERSGLKDIAVLDGGYAGYKTDQAVTKEFPKYSVGKFTVKDNPSVRVNLSDVKKLIGKSGVVFIDPRPEKLFRGEENIWIRNGHIPGARNIPWVTFTDAQNPHKLKSLDEIKKILADKKITPENDIIVSCSTGREATLQYVVLKHLLNYPKVRIYEGSWTEYSTHKDLPVATGEEKLT